MSGDCPLRPRHLEVTRLAATGLTYAEIGKKLWIATETVKHHLVFARITVGARNTTELVAIAVRSGWV